MKNSYFLLLSLALIILGQPKTTLAQGQSSATIKPMSTMDGEPIVCYFTPENMFTAVPLRTSLEQLNNARTGGTQAATIEVEYFGFTGVQQAAFQYAVDIWASLLSSDIPIRIQVVMSTDMGDGTLASTGWGGLNANFNNAQRINTWYVVSLAEKIAGQELNGVDFPDIIMQFNANNDNWYLGTDQSPPAGEFDFVSVALHEIAHGLGIFSHTLEDNAVGSYGNNVNLPLIYTQHLENGTGQNLVETFDNNSTALGDELTGDDLFFSSFTFDGGTLPKIHAPATFSSGSSIAHLNENTYLSGDPNSLMTPQLGFAESIHDPGLALDMLFDMGWISMNIAHDRVKDTEDLVNPIVTKAVIAGDNLVAADGAKLHYTYTDFGSEVIVNMAATGTPDEYAADIPAPGANAVVSYFIEVDDDNGRKYLSPGEAPDFFHQFVVAPDTLDPLIIHEPLSFVFTHDPTANIVATVLDNVGVGDLNLTYKINGSATTTIQVPLVAQDNDGIFTGEYALAWDLGALGVVKNDLVEYKLNIADVSAASNSAVHPGLGFNQIQVDALNPAVDFYQNDFSTALNDFVGVGFVIETQTGFSNNAIQSDHPYRTVDGVSPDDTVILQYLLKSPIILSEGNPSLQFDEVVLVEPGEPGTQFGDDEFWDYVVVEGSSDLGVTWSPLADGYDSRANSEWLTQWNSDIVTNSDGIPNSEAAGNEGLYKRRTIDMLSSGKFKGGDELLIRFKLYADQLAVGWGWAIDNVKIQIDDVAPEIAHVAPNYMNIGDTQLTLLAKVTDNAVLDSVTFEINLDGQVDLFGFDADADIYEFNLNFSPVTSTSDLKYRIIAVDSALSPNTTILPETGFFTIPVVELGAVKTSYINDFNTASTDFIGSNFIIEQETGFNDAAIQSLHPYSNAPVGVSEMSYLLKFPIKLNNTHAWMRFDEVALVDPVGDRVLVEASKDNGLTWIQVTDPYSAAENADWFGVFNVKDTDGNSIGAGNAQLMKSRLVDMLSSPDLNGGEEVLIRFTMMVDAGINGWGWTIDNLEIQGPTTAVEENELRQVEIYPNPVTNGLLHVSGDLKSAAQPRLQVMDLLGKQVYAKALNTTSGTFEEEVNLQGITPGFYIVKISQGEEQFATRIVIE